jgi:hypothetical protein
VCTVVAETGVDVRLFPCRPGAVGFEVFLIASLSEF